MLKFGVKVRYESLARRIRYGQKAPYRGAAVRVWGERSKRVASLEGEVLLYGMNGREVVVFNFAQLEEARWLLGSGGSVIS